MSLFICKHSIGTNKNLLLKDGDACWTNSTVEATFTYGCGHQVNSIEPLLDLFDVTLPNLIPLEFIEAMKVCGISSNIPWQFVMPHQLFMTRLKLFLDELSKAEKLVEDNLYSHFFVQTNKVISGLYPCNFDTHFAKSELQKTDSAALRSFLNTRRSTPLYCRTSTKTGRLTIKEGPQILTLKKEYRKVLSSSFPYGRLYEIDFTSLEPRVAFNITSEDTLLPGEKSPDDLYQFFIEKQQMTIQRDTAKLAVLCSLYGAGTSKLRSVLQKDGSNYSADMLIKRVESFFGLKELFGTLREQAKSGYITNFYGRPIEVTDARRNILVNNFLQSTAVDVALAGFCQIMEKIPSCKPVFIIHDALIMDVPKGQEDKLQDIVAQGFSDEKMGHFPLKLTRLK